MNPIDTFKAWYQEETEKSSVSIPSACCLSSIGTDGYPNARFVSLKEIIDDKFVITGPLNTRKGVELLAHPKASLVFWWTETARQVRIQGDAISIDDQLADRYFSARSRASKIVSQISKQGQPIENLVELTRLFEQRKAVSDDGEIERPAQWAGFFIVPKRVELMEFKKSRFHVRALFLKENDRWNKTMLQP